MQHNLDLLWLIIIFLFLLPYTSKLMKKWQKIHCFEGLCSYLLTVKAHYRANFFLLKPV